MGILVYRNKKLSKQIFYNNPTHPMHAWIHVQIVSYCVIKTFKLRQKVVDVKFDWCVKYKNYLK